MGTLDNALANAAIALTGSEPSFALLALIASASLVLVLGFRAAARRTEDADPLDGLFDRPTFESSAEQIVQHTPRKRPQSSFRTAVLSGRIDHAAQLRQIWGQDTRAEAIEQVAQVMRAGVRGTDKVSRDEDSITIIADGASEDEASAIARRLMRTLAQMPVPGLGEGVRFTASFGVAERLSGESDDDMHARAEAALHNAQSRGEERVIVASEWEEVKLLPAPALASNTPPAIASDKDAAAA